MNKQYPKFIFSLVAALVLVRPASVMAAAIQSPELSHLFAGSSKVWRISSETFMKIQANNGFVWNSGNQKNSVRSTHPDLRFLGIQVVEANAYFSEIGLSKMKLSIYNRGDVGWVKEEDFNGYLKTVRELISKWVGGPPKTMKSNRRTSKIKINRRSWIRDHTKIDLEWSATKKHERNGVTIPFRSEFIRLRLTSVTKKGRGARAAGSSIQGNQPISYALAKSKVTRNDNGDIYLRDIPMVNQGKKSYCATATVSRIMGYYGKEIDQHEIAQMVETSWLGTNPELMVELLKQLSHKLGFRIRIHQDFDFNDLAQMIEDYNRLARRERKPELVLYKNAPTTYYYQQMDRGLLTRMQTGNPALNRFYREITKHIQIGIPIAWSVVLGVVEEHPPLPQGVGGHMRLIMGYHPRTKEIIYTDSWGAGHEFKRMGLKDAVTITTGLVTIEPRSRRF